MYHMLVVVSCDEYSRLVECMSHVVVVSHGDYLGFTVTT